MAFTDSCETDTLARVHFSMAEHAEGDVLIGRARGQRARSLLEHAIDTHRSTVEPVAIDFGGIRGMTVPFADAFFVPLLSGRLRGYYEDHPVVVVNAKEDVSETLEAVLVNRDLAILEIQPDRQGSLLGGEPALQEAMRVAVELQDFTASELASRLGLTAQAANNRLKQLVRLGALVRAAVVPRGGGREYRYRLPATADTESSS